MIKSHYTTDQNLFPQEEQLEVIDGTEPYVNKYRRTVKFTIKFKGRELQHSNLGHELMDKIKTDIEKLGKVELQPKFEGKQMIMVIQPI